SLLDGAGQVAGLPRCLRWRLRRGQQLTGIGRVVLALERGEPGEVIERRLFKGVARIRLHLVVVVADFLAQATIIAGDHRVSVTLPLLFGMASRRRAEQLCFFCGGQPFRRPPCLARLACKSLSTCLIAWSIDVSFGCCFCHCRALTRNASKSFVGLNG